MAKLALWTPQNILKATPDYFIQKFMKYFYLNAKIRLFSIFVKCFSTPGLVVDNRN